jgi:hypothetical protein
MHVAAISEHEKSGASDARVVVPKLSRGGVLEKEFFFLYIQA